MTNIVLIVGNLGADPAARSTSGGDITTITVATSRRWNDKNTGEVREETEWHRVTCFNGLADNVAKYVRKGSKISVQGSIHYTSSVGQDGEKKYGVEIRADQVEFLSKAPEPSAKNPRLRLASPARRRSPPPLSPATLATISTTTSRSDGLWHRRLTPPVPSFPLCFGIGLEDLDPSDRGRSRPGSRRTPTFSLADREHEPVPYAADLSFAACLMRRS